MPQPIPQAGLPQPPAIPQPIPSPPTVPQLPTPPAIPDPLPTGESSSHGCYVSREHPVADSVNQYLMPVHRQLTGWAGSMTMSLAVPEHRIQVYGQENGPCVVLGNDGIQHIGLTPPDDPPADILKQRGSQYIYQYAHELGHVLSNHEDRKLQRFAWFEETLSELASLHALRANGRHGYANSRIGEHAAMRAEINEYDATGRVSDWYAYAIVQLGQNSTIRELNGAIACELLPHFEADPKLWASVTHINKWNGRNDDFRSYLDNWRQRLVSRGLPASAPDIVRAVLYGEGDVGEPPLVCSRIGELVAEEGEGASDAIGDPESGVTGSEAVFSSGDLQEVLRESMEGYDREIAQERAAMASSGQGMAAGDTGGILTVPGGSSGAMVTIPSAVIGQDDGTDGSEDGTTGESTGGSEVDGQASDKPEPKFEIPDDIAEAIDGEDPVARQIREAAEQEENPRLREALWEEYRKHEGLRSR